MYCTSFGFGVAIVKLSYNDWKKLSFQISGRPCLDGYYFFLTYLVESISEAICPGVSFVIRT